MVLNYGVKGEDGNMMQELEAVLQECRKVIITSDSSKHVQCLYIGGSIHSDDRIRDSDIDIIGIVYESFPEDMEVQINRELKKNITEIKCTLRVLYINELRGGSQRGFITTLLPIKIFIRRIPFFPLIWGVPLNIEETIGPYTIQEEIAVQSSLIRGYIASARSTEQQTPFEWIPKGILYLASLEAVLLLKAEYTTSFAETQKQWSDDKTHIVHDSMYIRKKNYAIPEKEKEQYMQKAISYIEQLGEKF